MLLSISKRGFLNSYSSKREFSFSNWISSTRLPISKIIEFGINLNEEILNKSLKSDIE